MDIGRESKVAILILASTFLFGVLSYPMLNKTEEPTQIGVGAPQEKGKKTELDEIYKTPKEQRADKKADYVIAKLPNRLPFSYTDNELTYEVVEVNKIEKGIEIYARVWKNGTQLGFGEGGTVDIERFRIINPPTLIQDDAGDIPQYTVTHDDNFNPSTTTRMYRYDPYAALVKTVRNIVEVTGQSGENIIQGKRGETTTTVFSEAGDGGMLAFATGADQATWDSVHDATASGLANNTTSRNDAYGVRLLHKTGTNGTQIGRVVLPFDTSSISSSDTVSSSTLRVSLNADEFTGAHEVSIGLVETSQSSETSVSTADYDQVGDAINNPTEGASRKSWTGDTGWITQFFLLNASGRGWIKKSGETSTCGSTAGYTCLGFRSGSDMDDSRPATGTEWRVTITFSEQAGDTEDPMLIIEHAGAGGGGGEVIRQSEFWF